MAKTSFLYLPTPNRYLLNSSLQGRFPGVPPSAKARSFPIPLRGSSGFAPDSLWPAAALTVAGVSHRFICMKRC